jgi:hypothetical protein
MFVIIETFLNPGEPSDAQFRVRPIPGQVFPTCMRVECSKVERNAFPLGSRFRLPVELVRTRTEGELLREVGQAQWERLTAADILCQVKLPIGPKLGQMLDEPDSSP